MGLMDILEQYAGQALATPPASTHDDFSTVASQASPDALGAGIAQALRNPQGGSFGASVERLFESSDPNQKAGLLAQLLQAVGPSVLSSIAGGSFARFAQGGGGTPAVSPADVSAVTPAQAGQLATEAQRSDPGVIDRVGSFYARHPMVVKALGAAALALAMNHLSKRA
jgi:hypothetical protein